MTTIPAPAKITAAALDRATYTTHSRRTEGNRSEAEGGSPAQTTADHAPRAEDDRLLTPAGGLLLALGLAIPIWGAITVGIITALRGTGLLP